MRNPLPLVIVALAFVVAGCGGSPYWLIKADHTSDPWNGEPVNDVCDPTADLVCAGVGSEWQHRNGSTTEADICLGLKRIRQCGVIQGWPAEDHTSTGGQFEIRHKVPM